MGRGWLALLLLASSVSRAPAQSDSGPLQFDPLTRGTFKYGDPCSTYHQCGFPGSICHDRLKICACHDEFPATNHFDKCGRVAGINESCFFNEQCEEAVLRTECRAGRCACLYEMVPETDADGSTTCIAQKQPEVSTRTVDPAMIGVLVGMALMFVIICVVLRLFSRARWRDNRTIFNTPNPRLMNVSLLRDSKLLHSQDRRGSRASIRPPSRQTSQQELRAHSPSQGSRRGSRASSNYSGASMRSAKSPTGAAPNHSSGTPMLESVTIEIREPKS